MDPRVIQMLQGGGQTGMQVHPAMLPGIFQIKTISEPLDSLEEFDRRENKFLADLPERVALIDRSFVVAEGRATLMLVVKVLTEA